MDELYGGCYTALTKKDAEEMGKLNWANDWGITQDEYIHLVNEHRKARETGDIRTMEKIEYRLEDINFHAECSALERGDYQTAMDLWED